MAYSLVGHGSASGSGGGTTGSIDTTGADLIIINLTDYNFSAGSQNGPSDNKSNTWTRIGSWNAIAGSTQQALFYCAAPTVGSGHTFSTPANTNFWSIEVQAFSGSAATPLDQSNQATNTNQPGSVTPTEANELVMCGAGAPDGQSISSINGGFTIGDNISYGSGANEAGALAYLIQTSAAAANPTWTLTSGNGASVIATFKASAGGATAIAARQLIVNQALVRAAYW